MLCAELDQKQNQPVSCTAHVPVAVVEELERAARRLEAIETVTSGLPAGSAPRNKATGVQGAPVVEGGSDPGSGTAPGVDRKDETTHCDDFTSVKWFGTIFRFTKGNQAEAIRVLWEAWDKGGHGLSQETIGRKIGSGDNHFQLAKVFRQRKHSGGYEPHPAWQAMIRSPSKGVFRLAEPDPSKNR